MKNRPKYTTDRCELTKDKQKTNKRTKPLRECVRKATPYPPRVVLNFVEVWLREGVSGGEKVPFVYMDKSRSVWNFYFKLKLCCDWKETRPFG